uniref:Insulin-like growth factor-binding protein complex acid labile subunit n=2 Tax=Lygus hesperus TaxID=30085 RepID=A0A0K8SVK2_LYGHE
MDHLEELDLSDNEIVNLHPNTIENNGNLRHLILRNNPGIQLANPNNPRHTPFLVSGSLVQLILANCEIKDIPKRAFASLGGLDYLDLSRNYLTELKDDGLAELINLETLDVSDNSISKISADAFVDIDDLTTLYLRGNPIKTLEGIEISGLEELDASRCDIEVLSPAVFDGFPELVLLNLSMNKIKDIDDEAFLALTALRYLDLSHNSIRSPLDKFMFQNCNDLETLSLANNRDFRVLDKFEGRFKLLYSLDLSNCGISQITDGVLDNFKYLTYLNVSGNNIGHIDANAFSALTHLVNLDLSKNRLLGLNSHIFLHNTMLNRLSVAGNMFKHVPAILFQPTIDLDYLDVSNNRINGLWNLSESFVMKNKNILGRLSTLNVAGNKIRKLHMHSFISITQLARLDISNNPIECTSDFSHMMQWLILNRVIPNRGNNPRPVEVSVIDNNIQWDQFIKEVCPEGKTDKIEKTDKMLHQPLDEEAQKITLKTDSAQIDEEESDADSNRVQVQPRPIITFRGEPIEIPSFDDIPDHMEIVEPIENKSVVIWPVFTIWCAIALIVLAIANATIIAVRRQRNRHPNVDYTTLERGFIVRRGGRSMYQKLYEDCSIPAVHTDAKSGSRLHTIFQLPQKV